MLFQFISLGPGSCCSSAESFLLKKNRILSPFVAEEKFRSQAVATIDLNEKFKADDLANSLRAQGIVYDIDSYRKLGRNQFRISMFHNVTYENLEKLTKIISLAVESSH